jgi:hypothetical protein
MDYFSELLDSYKKLKKRTFKITFINEQAFDSDPNFTQLKQVLLQAPVGGGYVNINYPGLEKYTYRKNKDNSVSIQIGPKTFTIFDGQGNIATLNAKKEPLDKNAQDKAIQTLLDAMSGKGVEEKPEDTKQEEQPQTPEEQMAAQAAAIQAQTPGNGLTMIGASPGSLENISNSARYIEGMAATEWYKAEVATSIGGRGGVERLARNAQAFTNPLSTRSFEYKLTRGASISLNDQGDFSEQPMSPALIYEATRSNDLLMSFLEDNISEEKCKSIKYRVGMYDKSDSNKLVFFGGNTNEGVVVAANPIQKIAIQRMQQNCEGASLEIVKVGQVKEKFLNDLRGKLAEHILMFISEMRNPETKEAGRKKFLDYLFTRRRQYLKAAQFFAERIETGALDLDSAGFGEASKELSEVFGNGTAIKGLLSVIGKSMIRIYNEAKPDGVRHIGKQISTGGEDTDTGTKGDVVFQYSDQAKANAFAQRTGAIPVLNPETGRYEVSISQKFLQKIDDSNVGEIKGSHRMLGHFTGQIQGSLNLLPKIDSKLFSDKTESDASKKLFIDVESSIQKTIESLQNDQMFKDATGKLRIQTAERVCKDIVKLLKEKLPFEIDDSELAGTIDAKYEHEENRQRIAEYLSRRLRIQKYSELTNGSDKATALLASKTLIRMSAITGYSKDDAVTFLATERGDLISFKTNDVYNELFESMRDGTFDPTSIEYTKAGIKFSTPSKAGETPRQLNLKTEGLDDSEVGRTTKFVTKISKATMLSMNRLTQREDVPQEVNAETLYKFMRGQMDLLETLLKVTR